MADEHLRDSDDAIVRVRDLVVEFPTRRGVVHAVSGVSLDVGRGETLGLVGESGCGKSTLGRAITYMPRPTRGTVTFEGRDLSTMTRRDLKNLRTRMQMIYQDPIASLNPRRTVEELVADPLIIWKRGDRPARELAVRTALEEMAFDAGQILRRRPTQLSGGQCQRVCIARALVLQPTMLICDEPVSALDVSVQAQILNLLKDLRESREISMIFVSHDLGVIRHIADRVAVMYLGKLCEIAAPESLYWRPRHPYTALLLDSTPELHDPDRRNVGPHRDLPSPIHPPSGCRFHTRCPRASEQCAKEAPPMRAVADEPGHYVACHHPLEVTAVNAPSYIVK